MKRLNRIGSDTFEKTSNAFVNVGSVSRKPLIVFVAILSAVVVADRTYFASYSNQTTISAPINAKEPIRREKDESDRAGNPIDVIFSAEGKPTEREKWAECWKLVPSDQDIRVIEYWESSIELMQNLASDPYEWSAVSAQRPIIGGNDKNTLLVQLEFELCRIPWKPVKDSFLGFARYDFKRDSGQNELIEWATFDRSTESLQIVHVCFRLRVD
jgi:hypothetical protein